MTTTDHRRSRHSSVRRAGTAAAGGRRAHDHVAQPAEHPPQPAAARVRDDPADHLRADVPLRVRRRDHRAGRHRHYVDYLMPGHLRADGRVRRAHHRRRPRRGPAEGPHRPLPLAADGALRGARRPHARRPRPQRLRRAADGRWSASSSAGASSTNVLGARRRRCCSSLAFAYSLSWVFAIVGLLAPRRRDRAGGVVPDPRAARVRVVGVRAGRVDARMAPGVRQAPAGVGRRQRGPRRSRSAGPPPTTCSRRSRWIIGIIAVCAPIAVRRYRRAV